MSTRDKVDYRALYLQTLEMLMDSKDEIRRLKRKYQGATISAGRWKSKTNQLQEVA